jgi:hypothetical protein
MAAVTDYFTNASALWTGQIGSGGVTDASVTTVPLSSVTGLTNGLVYYATIDRVDSSGTKTPTKREVVKGLLSGTNLINCVRGVEGTAQLHIAGKVVEILFTAAQFNDLTTGLEVEHNADGTHKTSAVVTPSGTQALTNKTIVGGSNTISGITEAMLSTSDLTTLDLSTSKHGFTPKAPNDSTKFLRGDATWAVPTAGSIKIGTFSRDLSAATGNQTVTGIGFTPSKVSFFITSAASSTKTFYGHGFMDGTNQFGAFTAMNATYNVADSDTSSCIYVSNASGTNNKAAFVSFGSGQFIINWTKAGSPTDTITIMYVAYS